MPIDKTKAKEKLKGKMREVIKSSSYFGNTPSKYSEADWQKANAIADVHRFKAVKSKKKRKEEYGKPIPPPVPVPR